MSECDCRWDASMVGGSPAHHDADCALYAGAHTPGRWRHRSTADHDYIVEGEGERPRTVAELLADDPRADARLIAAAPDLLAIVSAFVHTFDDVKVRERQAALFAAERAILPAAREAIAKATGVDR